MLLFLGFIAVLVFKTPCLLSSVKAAKHSFKPNLFSGTLLVASNACEKHRGFVRLFFNYRKQSMSATKTEIEVNKMFVCLTKYKSCFASLFL